jgi:LAO/AO transport system kinase
MAALRLRANGGDVAVLDTVATTSQGIDALASAISQRMTAPAPGRDAAIDRRRARARYLLLRAAHGLVAERLAAVGEAGLKRLADRVLAGELTADAAARQLVLDGSVP